MPFIDDTRCIGCGQCVEDCVRGLLTVQDGKARLRSGSCILCGHCVAVCPSGAIHISEASDAEILPYQPETFSVEPQNLLHFIKFRRSIRRFQKIPVEAEKIALLMDAGRYAPTGANRQKTRYILVQKQKYELTEQALKILHSMAGEPGLEEKLPVISRYRAKWKRLYEEWKDTGRDGLFYHADCVLLVIAVDPEGGSGALDAALAAANIELMANALHLGACYIGFFGRAVAYDSQLRERLGIKSNEKLIATMAIGYPDVHYHRTVARKPADLTIL